MHQHGGDIYSYNNVIDFSANINFKGMPQAVADAAKEGIDLCGSYPDTKCRALREAIGAKEQLMPEQIICGNGAAELIFSLVSSVKPKKALVTAPSFYEYRQALESCSCQVERYHLQEETGFQLQEDFLQQITPELDLVFLCNPNNPTGVLTEPEFLKEVLKRCEGCDTLLVLDECFNDFLEEAEHYSLKACLKESRHLFILKAFTKMYAMAGLRLGYGLCSNKKLLENMNQGRQPWSVSIPAQMAGVAAAKESAFVEESIREINSEKEKLKQELTSLGYKVFGSSVNYIFFKGPKDLYERCLKGGCLIRDCSNYEGLSKGWYRIAVKSPEDNRILKKVLAGRE